MGKKISFLITVVTVVKRYLRCPLEAITFHLAPPKKIIVYEASGVLVGELSGNEYDVFRKKVLTSPPMWGQELLGLLKGLWEMAEGFFVTVPIFAFWGFIAAAIFIPQKLFAFLPLTMEKVAAIKVKAVILFSPPSLVFLGGICLLFVVLYLLVIFYLHVISRHIEFSCPFTEELDSLIKKHFNLPVFEDIYKEFVMPDMKRRG